MPAAQCSICISDLPIENFRLLPCGHAYCEKCTKNMAHGTLLQCPMCRKKFKRDQAVKIHLDFVDIGTAVDELSRLGTHSKPGTVEHTGTKLEALVEQPLPAERVEALKQAIDDFRQRLSPLFAQCKAQSDRIDTLNRQSERDMHEVKVLRHKLRRAEQDLQDNEAQTLKAITLAEQAKDELVQLRKIVEDSQKRSADIEAEAVGLRDDNRRLRGLLDAQSKDLHRRRAQIVQLKERQTDLEEQIEASLQLEHTVVAPNTPHLRSPAVMNHPISPFGLPSSPLQLPNDFEGLPQPHAKSTWQIEEPRAKKRKLGGFGQENIERKIPISLDRTGRPLATLHLGPKRRVNVRQ